MNNNLDASPRTALAAPTLAAFLAGAAPSAIRQATPLPGVGNGLSSAASCDVDKGTGRSFATKALRSHAARQDQLPQRRGG